GHLSNKQALAVFLEHRPTYMSHLFLSHLSRQNNHPKKVKELFEPVAESTKIIVAPRDKPTELYHIRSNRRTNIKLSVDSFQMQLFQ
ncbi:MAG: MBL fold metallo-hydrolase, partial [Flammeovirgaceae bacterium]